MNNYKIRAIKTVEILLFTSAVFWCVSCSRTLEFTPTAVPSSPISVAPNTPMLVSQNSPIIGVITSMHTATNGDTMILVENLEAKSGTLQGRFLIRITAQTQWFRKQNEAYVSTHVQNVSVGKKVEVVPLDGVLESDPASATAKEIAIIE